MEKNNKELLKLGDVYVFQLATGSVVTGVLIGSSENLIGDKVQRYYRLALNESKYINFVENEIVNIHTVEIPEDKIGYFKEFEHRYGVKCFDKDDNLLSASVIMGKVLVSENIWDKLSEKERIEFIEQIDLQPENVVELMNIYMKEREENKRLHNDKVKILDASLELMENYNKYTSATTYAKNIYELFFKGLGMEKFINSICLR